MIREVRVVWWRCGAVKQSAKVHHSRIGLTPSRLDLGKQVGRSAGIHFSNAIGIHRFQVESGVLDVFRLG